MTEITEHSRSKRHGRFGDYIVSDDIWIASALILRSNLVR